MQLREIEASKAIGDQWVVTSGLQAGDRVIVSGLQRIRPGIKARAISSSQKTPAPNRNNNVAGLRGLSWLTILLIARFLPGTCHYYDACRRSGDHELTGCAVSADCATDHYHQRYLSGADAQTVEDSVTQVIEQNMNGLDGLMYMSSTSDAAGNASITLTFETGTSPDIAQVQVQNKLQLAMPSLPEAVQQQGISVDKSSSNILMVAAFISDNGSLNQYDIADYVASNIKDPLSRTAGVGSVQLFGSEYAMRIWLDPQKLNKYNLVPSDVISQIKVQNNQISGGQLGGMPQAADQQLNASIIVQTRLQTPEEFGKILLKVQQDGSQVLLRDVARVELGAEDYSTVARYNGKPAAGIAIKLATGANAWIPRGQSKRS